MDDANRNPSTLGTAGSALLDAPSLTEFGSGPPGAPPTRMDPVRHTSALIDALPFAVVHVTAELEIVSANKEASRLLGLGSGARGTELRDAWPEFSLRRFARRLCAPRAIPVEARANLEGGRILELTGLPRSDGALLVLRDVTDRARREEADRAFVANAAHELRGSLGGIASGVEALELGAKEDPEQRDAFLRGIGSEVSGLRRQVDGLLVLARAHAQPRALDLEPVALSPLVHDVAESLSVHAGVDVQTTCDRAVSARGLRPLVEIALRNIARNAAYSTRRGTIRLSCSRAGERAALEVADDGPGIPPEARERLFERFSAHENGEGFGIGLPLTLEIARLLDGDVEVATGTSGTTVRLLLPAA
jgi:signal transduction histidine kinase